MLRRALVLAALGAAASAAAFPTFAFSNLAPAPDRYAAGSYAQLAAGDVLGYRFASAYTGDLTGFALALNGADASGASARFTLDLYRADGADGTSGFGTRLASYVGATTGQDPDLTASALSTIAAVDPVRLRRGESYWMVVTLGGDASWNMANVAAFQPTYYGPAGDPGNPIVALSTPQAYAVGIDAVPGPSGALAFAALAACRVRRRRR